MIFDNQVLNYFIFIMLVILFVILISFITYKYIEQLFIKLGKNYIKRGTK